MAPSITIGLVYYYNENWIGGTYYVLNLVHALKTLPENEMPAIAVISNSDQEYRQILDATQYPYLSFTSTYPRYSLFERAINKAGRIMGRNKNLVQKQVVLPNVIFPVLSMDQFQGKATKIFWIPDFQEKYLPHFFSSDEIATRNSFQKELAYSNHFVIFSSKDAQSSFNYFFPNPTAKQFVVPFAVSQPAYQQLNAQDLLEKYQLPVRYYFSPNQFWAHKNHMVILKALKIIKDKGIDICMVFSGKENDRRNPHYFTELTQFVKDNQLDSYVRFLGFIDRLDQLKLMSMSLAIVQPSKFEGWSTVIEDAKSMNKFVIASGLPVHREQIKINVDFFDMDNEVELAEKMMLYKNDTPVVQPEDYSGYVKKFGQAFSTVIKEVSGQQHSN